MPTEKIQYGRHFKDGRHLMGLCVIQQVCHRNITADSIKCCILVVFHVHNYTWYGNHWKKIQYGCHFNNGRHRIDPRVLQRKYHWDIGSNNIKCCILVDFHVLNNTWHGKHVTTVKKSFSHGIHTYTTICMPFNSVLIHIFFKHISDMWKLFHISSLWEVIFYWYISYIELDTCRLF